MRITKISKIFAWRITLDNVIETKNLSKSYGDILAISNIDLEIPKGQVFGYLGPNGAGKTTTIKLLMDFIRPTKGTAKIFGLDSRENSVDIKKKVGYLPGDIVLYDQMTGNELLKYFCNMRKQSDWQFVIKLAERLDVNLEMKIKKLSRGNRQKLGLIQAFMHKPELIIMDEPSSGLDPLLQQEFYTMVDEVKSDGRTIFISSHILPEVERICDQVGIIREGKLITVEQVNNLKDRSIQELEIHFGSNVSKEKFTKIPGLKSIHMDNTILFCTVIGSPDQLIKTAACFEVTKIISHQPSLEDVFLSYYGDQPTNVE